MIYVARCSLCGAKRDYTSSVENRFKTPQCCGKPMERIFSPTMGKVDVPAVRR